MRPNLFAMACLAPYVLLLLLFGVIPVLYAVFESLFDTGSRPAGIDSYVRVFTDFRFWPAVVNVATFMAIYLPMMVILTLVLSLLVHRYQKRFGASVRMSFLLPGAVTGSASVLLWYIMLTPSLSPFGPALRAMGFESIGDIIQPSGYPLLFALMAFVGGFGSWVLIFYGALQAIPQELIEAALLDGCSEIQLAVQVKLPLIGKYITFLLILTFTAGLQIFAEPSLLYGVNRIGSPWWSLNQVALDFAFTSGDFASSSALSLILLVVCTLAASLLIWRSSFFESIGTK